MSAVKQQHADVTLLYLCVKFCDFYMPLSAGMCKNQNTRNMYHTIKGHITKVIYEISECFKL